MKKILAFAGSNHAMSINHQLVEFTASLLEDFELKVLDIRNWEIPMYSINMDSDQMSSIGYHHAYIVDQNV